MSLLALEGFEIDRHQSLQNLKWGQCTSLSFYTPGRLGWGYYADANIGNYTFYLDAQHDTLICGTAVKFTDNDASELFEFKYNGSSQICLAYSGGASRRLRLTRGNINSPLIAESTYLVPTDSWLYIEIKIHFDNTVGTFEIRVNGITIMSGTGQDTFNTADPNQVFMDSQQPYDDIYICDDQGANWNDFQGEIAIEGVLPNADGTHGDFTPLGAGANYVEVDEDGDIDDDTTYNSSTVAANKDTFDHASLSNIEGDILGVMVTAWGRKDDAGSRSARAMIRSGTTEETGDTIPMSDSYGSYKSFHPLDPDTSAAWTEAAVNASEMGYEQVV